MAVNAVEFVLVAACSSFYRVLCPMAYLDRGMLADNFVGLLLQTSFKVIGEDRFDI